jgi:Restriction endonuclease
MLPSSFVEAAGFPERWQEKDLQQYLGDRLKERGFQTQLEVQANGGRADIVTSWQGGAIIECKKYLDRNTIYQAVGQLNLYGLNNTHRLIVMGFLTPDAREQASALKTASMVEQNPRIQVVFVNTEEEWLPGNRIAPSRLVQFFSLPKLLRTNLDLGNWRWWFRFAKCNPMLMVFAVALVSLMASQMKREFTRCQQTNHLLSCLFSQQSPLP